VQRAQQAERIAVAVQFAPRSAGNLVAHGSDLRGHAGAVEHLDRVAWKAGLREEGLHVPRARHELVRGQAYVQAPLLSQRDVDRGRLEQLRGKARPFARGSLRPPAVRRQPESFALHPDEAEVAARCAVRDVAFVEQGKPRPEGAQAECQRRTDEAAADDRDLEFFHGVVSTRAKRRIAGICTTNSVNVWSPPPRTYWYAPP
jgi:hypothetical protein